MPHILHKYFSHHKTLHMMVMMVPEKDGAIYEITYGTHVPRDSTAQSVIGIFAKQARKDALRIK